MEGLYGFIVKDIGGKDVPLSDFRGKVLLIVNVASKCGFTPQYKALQELYLSYKGKDFEILGFPSNDFLGQEPGTNEEIRNFCSLTYGVTFPMFSKIRVKGKEKAPLYAFLTDKTSNPHFGGEIAWNFNKFLIDKKGYVIARFDSKAVPDDPAIISAIDKALDE